MKVHKYNSKEGTFYALSAEATKPIKGETVTGVSWAGWANPGGANVSEIANLKYSAEAPEPKEEPKEEKKKASSVMDALRMLAEKTQNSEEAE